MGKFVLYKKEFVYTLVSARVSFCSHYSIAHVAGLNLNFVYQKPWLIYFKPTLKTVLMWVEALQHFVIDVGAVIFKFDIQYIHTSLETCWPVVILITVFNFFVMYLLRAK
jgi:hypothetical protein